MKECEQSEVNVSVSKAIVSVGPQCRLHTKRQPQQTRAIWAPPIYSYIALQGSLHPYRPFSEPLGQPGCTCYVFKKYKVWGQFDPAVFWPIAFIMLISISLLSHILPPYIPSPLSKQNSSCQILWKLHTFIKIHRHGSCGLSKRSSGRCSSTSRAITQLT